MKKKLLLISGVCWIFVVSIIFFKDAIGSMLIAYDLEELVMVPLRWFFGFATLIGAGIPFGIWVVALSDWGQKLMDESTIYQNKDD